MSQIPVQEFYDPRMPEDDVAQCQLAVENRGRTIELDNQHFFKKFRMIVREGHQWTVEREAAFSGVARAQKMSEEYKDRQIYFLQWLATREARADGVQIDDPDRGLLPVAMNVEVLTESEK